MEQNPVGDGGDDTWGFLRSVDCCISLFWLVSASSRHLSVGTVTVWCANRIARWLEGNIGKYAGGGSVTAEGWCRGGKDVELPSVGSG